MTTYTEDQLRNMTITELRATARSNNIAYHTKKGKEQLISDLLLNDHYNRTKLNKELHEKGLFLECFEKLSRRDLKDLIVEVDKLLSKSSLTSKN